MATESARLGTATLQEPSDTHSDPRVAAVLEVLGGNSVVAVAARWSVEPTVLRRWVRAFVDAGVSQVTNQPDPEAARRRDRFLTAFAHELRTPLAVAQGWIDVLADGDLPPAMAAATIRRLSEALQRLAGRVIDVELLGASSLGLVRLAPATVTVGELVEGLGIDVVDDTDAAVVLTVDVDLFRRVLRDLWGAASGSPAPRSLRLEVRQPSPWVELRVVRDADPIDPRVLQALFEPFDINDDATGVTIGLYLARALTVGPRRHARGGAGRPPRHTVGAHSRRPARTRHHSHKHRNTGDLVTFTLACGDVMPGCSAHFETSDRDLLLASVADHAAADHGITTITPHVLRAIEDNIVAA